MRASTTRLRFIAKLGLIAGLVALFDWLFLWQGGGSTIGAFAAAWALAFLLARGGLWRSRAAWAIMGALALFVAALIWDPSTLAWAMFWCALMMLALLPRTDGFDDAWRWALRLMIQALAGWLAALIDLSRLARIRRRGKLRDPRAWAALLALPLIGTVLFTALFASANPLIANALADITLPDPATMIVSVLVAVAIWSSLRPARFVTRLVAELPPSETRIQEASLPSLLVALVLFNLLFGIENGLDLAFLWSGAPLPAGTTLADYAHQGAYSLIATALLAGLFVLMFLRPGTVSAASPAARRLVVLWVAQNLFLVASSALRTIDYIEAYSLTRLRIAALIWMGLVALGLALICWRLIQGLSARWLINANALAATIVLTACCFVDLGSIAADWNVRHAREVGGEGSPLDLCYLDGLDVSALVPLAHLETRKLPPRFQAKVRRVRDAIMDDVWGDQPGGLRARQEDWHNWTWRSALRVDEARGVLGPALDLVEPRNLNFEQSCDGLLSLVNPPPPPVSSRAPIPAQPAPPLTKVPAR